MVKWRLIENLPDAGPRWPLLIHSAVSERAAGLAVRFFVKYPITKPI
jgi:hypothetical protein